MSQPLDLTRFAPPDHAPGAEQRMADHERDVRQRDELVDWLLTKHCHAWNDKDFLVLAKRSLEQFLDLRNSRLTLVQAYELIDDAVDEMNRMPEVRDGE